MKKSAKAGTGISIIAAIVFAAYSLVGTTEKPNNSGFYNQEFEKEMKAVGWNKYDSWCVYFCKVCWHRGITVDSIRNKAMKLISGNSQATLYNFTKDKSGMFFVSDSVSRGCIVIWQHYTNGCATYTGHAGICVEDCKSFFYTIEGNTNDKGGREGYIVAKKKRTYNTSSINGLRYRKSISINPKLFTW